MNVNFVKYIAIPSLKSGIWIFLRVICLNNIIAFTIYGFNNSSTANFRYHFTVLRNSELYVTIWSDKSTEDIPKLYSTTIFDFLYE